VTIACKHPVVSFCERCDAAFCTSSACDSELDACEVPAWAWCHGDKTRSTVQSCSSCAVEARLSPDVDFELLAVGSRTVAVSIFHDSHEEVGAVLLSVDCPTPGSEPLLAIHLDHEEARDLMEWLRVAVAKLDEAYPEVAITPPAPAATS
jgi:hypothetical protein